MAGLGVVDDRLPDPGVAEVLHRGRLPVVEVADDGECARVRRPHGERDAAVAHVRAEDVVQPLVPALPRQVQVDLAEDAAHTGAPSSSRAIPATGIWTQLGRLSSS